MKINPPADDLGPKAAEVKRTLQRGNPRKAAGPDGIPARVLKECLTQLNDVLMNILNYSLEQSVVPACLKCYSLMTVLPNIRTKLYFLFADDRTVMCLITHSKERR